MRDRQMTSPTPAANPAVSGRRPVGRPTKLTPVVRRRILDYLRAGNRRGVSARASGVSEATFYRWLNEDEVFRAEVEQAEAEAEVALVEVVRTSLPKYPTLAYKMLEARGPEWRPWRPLPASDEVTPKTPPAESFGSIVIPAEVLRQIGTAKARAARGDLYLDEETKARRERLVTRNHPERRDSLDPMPPWVPVMFPPSTESERRVMSRLLGVDADVEPHDETGTIPSGE